MDLLTYCKRLPKIELHAHLTGSLSDETVLKLLNSKLKCVHVNLPKSAEVTIRRGHRRTLEEQEMKTNCITVRLLLSIDRSRGIDDAWNTLQLAKEYKTHEIYKNLICGLDVSGNPACGNLTNYIPVLEEAKKCGLKLAIHLAEIPNEAETLAVLRTGLVDRIGHGTFIHPSSGGSQELLYYVQHYHLPLELCLSSNVKCGTVKNIEDHHLAHWRKENHPVIICTDDKGVFSTSLSEEFHLCAEAFNLSTLSPSLVHTPSLQRCSDATV
nr:adenosine deaminase-like protein isoform X5 [Cherax quadricarinatus]